MRAINYTNKRMKTAVLLLTFAMALSVQAADQTVKITNVHLCCKGCTRGVEKAVSTVPTAKATFDQDADTVELTAPDKATLQKAADAFVAGGYFGKSSDPEIKLNPEAGAKGKQVKSLKLEGAHLCCGECVSALEKAVMAVPGVKAHTATKNAQAFEVTGDFNDKDVLASIQKAGLNAKVAK